MLNSAGFGLVSSEMKASVPVTRHHPECPSILFGNDRNSIDFYWVSRQSAKTREIAKTTSSGQNITKGSKQSKIADENDIKWSKMQFTNKKVSAAKTTDITACSLNLTLN